MVKLIYLIITIIYSASCICLGMVILSFFLSGKDWWHKQSQLTVFATSFLFGQGILANIWIIAGLFGVFTSVLIWVIITLILAAYLFRFKFRNPVSATDIFILTKTIKEQTLSWKFISILLVFLGILLAIKSVVLPPTGDAEAFYMVLPKILVDSHHLFPQPNFNSFSQIGLSGEMHFAALISLASPYAAKFFVWIDALALTAMLLAICSTIGCTLKGKITAIVILLTSTTVTAYIFDGKVDLFGAAFGLAAYYWILQTRSNEGRVPYILTGIFLSFAMIAKFSNIPVIIPGVLLILIWNTNISKRKAKESVIEFSGNLMIIGFFAAILIIPHLIKNLVLFNEPFAPFYFFKAHGTKWIEQAWYSPETTKYILKTYPLALVFGRYPMQGGTISALIFAFMPLFLILPEWAALKERKLLQIIASALLGVGLWMIIRPSVLAPRYILSTLLLFIPVAAWIVEKIFEREKLMLLKFSVTLSMIIFLILTCYQLQVRNTLAGAYHWLKDKSYDYEAKGGIAFLNTNAHRGDRIFFEGYYTYYLRSDLLQCINNPEEKEVNELDMNYLYDHGYKYFISDTSIDRKTKEFIQSEDSRSWLTVAKVYDDYYNTIYHIISNDSTKMPAYYCKQCNPPVWSVLKQN
jgi:hypothetical protein